MTSKALLERWKSPEGRLLAEDVVQYLTGQRRGLPEGLGTYEGRQDLRGLVVASPTARGRVSAENPSAESAGSLVEVRGAGWGSSPRTWCA